MTIFTPAETYIHLSNLGAATAVDVDDQFWATLARRDDVQEGRILGLLRLPAGADHTERHPAGDELLVLISGAVDVILEDAGVASLRGGQACIVPRGVWHRLHVLAPSELLFLTPGRGTELRP